MQVMHGMTIYCDAEDYEIVPGVSYAQVFRRKEVIANFPSVGEAEAYIHRRTNPKELPVRLYRDMCRCGWAKEGWDYASTEGVIYEMCNKCKKPLRMNIVDHMREESLKDFDLEDIFKD